MQSHLARIWKWMLVVLATGMLFQTTTTTSCQSIAANSAAGLTSVIVDQLIYTYISQAMGLNPASGYGGLTGLGAYGGLAT